MLIPILTAQGSMAGLSVGAVIKGFRLQACTANLCTQIESTEALQGQWGLMTFTHVKVKRTVGTSVQIIEGHDAVYDANAQTLAIRKVTHGPAQELVIDLQTGRLQTF